MEKLVYVDISGYAACAYGIDGMCRSDLED